MQTSVPATPGTASTVPASAVRTEIRHLYKRERARGAARTYERGLLNLIRKLTWAERVELYVYAERLALARIKAHLQRRRRGGRA